MSKIILNFFGEEILLEKNKLKSIAVLRKCISKLFLFTEKDAAEILLTYMDKGKKNIIKNEQDLKTFLKSNINKIDLDISQESQLYKENLNQIKENTMKEQKDLDELLKKKEELKKLKETSFASEKKEIEEIKKKICELKCKKNLLKKKILKGIEQIDKNIKENDKKIEEISKKLGDKANIYLKKKL
jgi:hypothetical protein